MSPTSRLRDFLPMRFLNDGYQKLPAFADSTQNLPFSLPNTPTWARGDRVPRFRGRMSIARVTGMITVAAVALALLMWAGHHRREARRHNDQPLPLPWEHFYRLDGYYNGIRTLKSPSDYRPGNRYNLSVPDPVVTSIEPALHSKEPAFDPVRFNPYPDYKSQSYLGTHEEVRTCYLDANETTVIPDVHVYPGIPVDMPVAFYGSHKELGLEENVCFERYGRLGPYGYGYNQSHGGTGIGEHSERTGSDKIFAQTGFVDYSDVDWADAQQRCQNTNAKRFNHTQTAGKLRVKRHAYVLRTWTGYKYGDLQILTIRAMINELSLKSGGEYDVHLLVHVKDNSIPIWADKETYRKTLEANVPREFWNISTLWSEQQMVTYYPEPFPNNFANMAGSGIHGVYRSAHFPLQWFSQQHPEYDFVWNWEMDIRLTGHYYEFNTRVGEWARQQPRKGLWERSRRFYIPEYHGDWKNFTKTVEKETLEVDMAKNDVEKSGPLPVWGPVRDFANSGLLDSPDGTTPPTSWEDDNYEWGVGEEADLLVFNPIFDPALTNWVFSWDVTGYDTAVPIPPRRTAIITVARLSKRLLNTMHEETWRQRHTMFPEMFPPSVAFHHGLKAVYVPHPVFFDRDWNIDYMNQIFNHPKEIWDSPFGWGEHNLQGSSFYYNSGFSGALWRRWLGISENKEGGRQFEEKGTGRMCLRTTLHHPIKSEDGPTD